MPKRPGLGKCGKKITLSANFFEVKYKDHDIYHYDVTIEPSKCPASLNRIAIERMVSVYPEVFGHHKPVFDGKKNMYTIAPLDIGDGKVKHFYLCTLFTLLNLPSLHYFYVLSHLFISLVFYLSC